MDLRFRNNRKVNNLNEAKYFGLTLDKLLYKYDYNELKRNELKLKYFSFIKPSFLLDRVIRILPTITKDYKLAYISALAGRTFNYVHSGNTTKSFQTLNYLSDIGIDEKEVIFELISDDLFVNKMSELKEEEKIEFVESELGKKIKEHKDESEILKSKNKKLEEQKDFLTEKSIGKDGEIAEIERSKETYKSSYQIGIETQERLIKELKKVKKELERNRVVKKTDDKQQEIIFEDNSADKKPWYKKFWVWLLGLLGLLATITTITGMTVFDIYDRINSEEIIEIEQTLQDSTKIRINKSQADSLGKGS